ncbi:HepT-like ribonuclease domain-containing protein [Methanospirillum purgamenti]|jgi:uncharacterized protein with HEPN domain|uniref:DUF86 domain-containing protein n=1 Tax=Methanospirillum hungatei TaxID=2203 RepID=A0A8F5VP07_METHU|nr:DUF86 domain-containing protein [Methanospirillum hungatei]QXO94785.1 DUF86 domain-containing protein [Methanospirillum hungatei]
MSEKRDLRIFLTDILNATEKIIRYNQEKESSQNVSTDKDLEAIIYNLLVLGEASRSIPEDFREEHPEIPWKRMVGMRDKLIHQYWGMQQVTIWNTITRDIPDLREKIRKIIDNYSDRE